MALLTSYRYRGVELNDGISYAVPNSGHSLDDRQAAEETWAYRREGLPVSTGITLKEGVIPLNIHIIASSGQDFQAKLDVLLAAFNTTDAKYYRLERKLPHEQYYRYIEVAPRQLVVSRTERKVTVTLHTAERAWKEDTLQTATLDLFSGTTRIHTLNINYEGLTPVEPTVAIQALEIGSGDTFLPLYYREVEVYVQSPEQAINNPILLLSGWNTSALVSANKMRSDGLDITVFDAEGRTYRRVVTGSQSSRGIWVLPEVWPTVGPPAFLNVDVVGYNASATELPVSVGEHPSGFDGIPSSGTISIGDEIMSYTGKRKVSGAAGFLTGITRGLHGTTPIDFTQIVSGVGDWMFAAIKYRYVLRVGYGYATGFQNEGVFQNDFEVWPLLDYSNSTNKEWRQASSAMVARAAGRPRPLSWVASPWISGRAGEIITIEEPTTQEGPLVFDGNRLSQTGVSTRPRAVLTLPSGRNVTSVRLTFQLKRGNTGQDTTLEISRTRRNFSERFSVDPVSKQVFTKEVYDPLGTHTTTAATTSVTTSWMNLYQELGRSTHLFVWLSAVPFNSLGDNFSMTTVQLTMDALYRAWPTVRFISGVEKGIAYGEYPVVLDWQNLSDPDTPKFSIWPRMLTNQTITYDCSSYEVTGEPLANCSYSNLTWLRLVPGTNQIRITGAEGTGRARITISWRNKR